MPAPEYDALIIGGGPGGSTAAAYLARAGRRVLLLEKEQFPRFHVGESLLPYNRQIFRELELLPVLERAGFVRKVGAQFCLANGEKSVRFLFRHSEFAKESETIQVERATFDHVLLRHAAGLGAEIREGWAVTGFVTHPDHLTIQAQTPEGAVEVFRASYLIDASGRANLTGNQEGLRVVHPHLKKLALYGHFTGVLRDEGESGGDTVIVRLEDKWFWLIPISATKTSVGCVLDQAAFARARESPRDLFHRLCQSNRVMRERMRQAQKAGPIRTTSDFSYHNRRLVGPRLLRVGDAAGFMDPIFSAGVYLAMHSGKLAAHTVQRAFQSGQRHQSLPRFRDYERRVRRAMKCYWNMVEHFYRPAFMELFLEPRHKWKIPAAVSAVLAGELEGGWAMRWRLRIFFWLLKVQRFFPLVPRVSFAERANPHPESGPLLSPKSATEHSPSQCGKTTAPRPAPSPK